MPNYTLNLNDWDLHANSMISHDITLLCGTLCMFSGIFHFIHFLYYRKDKRYLFFSLFCFVIVFLSLLNTLHTFHILENPDIYCFIPMFLSITVIIRIMYFAKKNAQEYISEKKLTLELQKALATIRKTETTFLSSQLKPHFLFNVLNLIAGYCFIDASYAKFLTNSLNHYFTLIFRYDTLSGTVPLATELELVQSYTLLEKARFSVLTVDYCLPEKIPAVSLPSLTLQPLIENAIKHGIRMQRGPGTVTVSVIEKDYSVLIEVKDTGVGMNEAYLNDPDSDIPTSLQRINQTLMERYTSGLSIESSATEGTTVSFHVPLLNA